MENKGVLTKVLAVAGTVFVCFPILAPILISAIFFALQGVFRFDYLMPIELGLFAFGGGILLLMASIRVHSHSKLIGWGFGIDALMALGILVIPEWTGLSDGTTPIGGWEWMLVLAVLAVYTAAVIVIGVGGTLLLRDVFKPGQRTALTG